MHRRPLRLAGVLLIGVGIGLLGFMASQVAASDARAAAAQDALLSAEAMTLAEAAPTATPAPETPAGEPDRRPEAPEPPHQASASQQSPTPPGYGEQVATMSFSRVIEAEYAVVEGTDTAALQQGPGRYRSSALPGQPGNFAVAGHRTTYGSPFADIDQLRDGDRIYIRDEHGNRYTYRVTESRIVTPKDTWVIAPDPLGIGRPLLTLTTCHPKYSARERFIVWAELEQPASPSIPR